MSHSLKLLAGFVLLFSPTTTIVAQQGVSSMSVGVSRAGIGVHGPNGRFLMPPPEMIRVEEYINYHRHALPFPAEGNRVHLDLARVQIENGKQIVQVGITTPQEISNEQMAPLNLVLVIDRSGSMSGDRIANVKKAIRAMLENFRQTDKISIVGFSSDARVHLAPCKKGNVDRIDQAISEIEAGGGTNLYAGLMLGYQQALGNYDPEMTNRVIFLTDGNANIGTTETDEIASASKKCNQRGITLSTIGLGKDFNHQLLRELAERGRGLVHFVNDAKDIKKTFVKEVVSLLAPAANKVRLSIDFGSHEQPVKIFGYQPKRKGNSEYVIRLDDLNYGVTQVVLAELPATFPKNSLSAKISYVDAISNEKLEIASECSEPSLDSNKIESLHRNYAIAKVAFAMRNAAELSQKSKFQNAEKQLVKGIKQARKWLKDPKDKAANRIIKLAEEYHTNIKECFTSIE